MIQNYIFDLTMKEITKQYKRMLFKLKKKINIDDQIYNGKSLNDFFNYYGLDISNSQWIIINEGCEAIFHIWIEKM